MTLNTRRMMGMASNGTQLIEAMDAFKRKHVSQNKEIIHRNSDLLRANADLTKRLRAVQEELIVSRREHAAVIAVNAQLEARIAELEREVNKARSSRRRRSTSAQYDDDIQRQPAMHATDLHTMQANLANVILQLRGMHALCYQAACPPQEAQYPPYEPVSPPISPPSAHLAHRHAQMIPPVSVLQRPPPKNAAETMLAYPDLSHISEGSQEPSLCMAALRLDDVDEDAESDEEHEQEETVMQGYYDHINLAQSAGASSRASSIEPDFDADSLIAKPLAEEASHERYAADTACDVSEVSSARSMDATKRPLRKRRSSSRLAAAEDTDGSSESNASSNAPMGDIRQIQRLPLRKKSRPSLLDDLGFSPGQFSTRILDPSLTASASVLHGSAAQSNTSDDTARRSPRVQKNKVATDRRTSADSIDLMLTAEKGVATGVSQRRKSLIGAMTARPADAKYSSLDAVSAAPAVMSSARSAATEKRPMSTSQKTATNNKPAPTAHRRARSVPVETAHASVTKPAIVEVAVSKTVLRVADLARPRRSTTPEMEPPPADILQILQPAMPLLAAPAVRPALAAIKPSSVGGQRAPSQSPRVESADKSGDNGNDGKDAPSKITVRRRAASVSQVADDAPNNRRDAATPAASNPVEDAAASEVLQADAAAARDGRRSRVQVSYQEPSLSKKMRQPAGYVPSIKTAASMRNVVGGGVRRKSSLQTLYDRSDLSSATALSDPISEEASQ